MIDLCERYSICDSKLPHNQYEQLARRGGSCTYPSVVLLLYSDGRWLLVQPDSEPLQLIGEDRKIDQGFQNVENDEDQITGSGYSDDLSTTTFTVFGSFYNT
jgi:hypothetical protein